METTDITITGMAVIYSLLIAPYAIMRALNIRLLKDSSISTLRMTIQLVLVGLYLKVIFDFNSLWINFAWVLVMVTAANYTVLRGAKLKVKRLFIPCFFGISLSAFFVAAVFVFIAIGPDPVYDARYLIPITGMILGNCLRSNVISLERFYAGIKNNDREYLTYLLLGATPREAALPYMRAAIRAALAPTVATMATMGVVSLPGMMTGQILGGSFPLVAIKYQIGIMIAIFAATSLSTTLNILLSMRTGFDAFGVIKNDIFAQSGF